MREEWLRLETAETFAEGLLWPVRFRSGPVDTTPAWPD